MKKYMPIIKDALILVIFSTIFALIFKFVFDQIRGKVVDNPLITASLQNNLDLMKDSLSEKAFKSKPEGASSYEEFKNNLINHHDEQGRTPLMWISYMNLNDREKILEKEGVRLEQAKFLIEDNADINAKDNDGWTALSWASWTGFPKIATLFIEKGGDVNAADVNGQTPLMFAALRGNAEVAKILVDNGAQKELKNKNGKTALDLAKENMEKYSGRKAEYDKVISSLQ